MDIISTILARNQAGKPLAYDENATKTLIGERDIVFSPNEELGGICALAFQIDSPPLTDITKFELSFIKNVGSSYSTIQITEEKSNNNNCVWNDGVVHYGDLSLFGLEGGFATSFGIIIDTNQNQAVIAFHEEISLSILMVDCDYNRAVPIDPKYIPGAVLPVVEITTELANGAVLTKTESEALASASKYGTPLVVNTVIDGVSASEIASRVQNDEVIGFMFQYFEKKYFFVFVIGGDNWVVNVEEGQV